MLFEAHSPASLAPISILKKNQFIFYKTDLFVQKASNFERFESFYYSTLILRQICFNLAKKNITFSSVNFSAWRQLASIG